MKNASVRSGTPSRVGSRHHRLPDQFAPTLELKVNFLRSARPGPIVGTARVVHRGGTIAFLAGELSDADGQLLATATATARVVRLSSATES